MGGISKRSDTFFRVGPAVLAKPECFAVKRGAVSETRCDVDVHHPEHLNLVSRINELPDTATISEIIATQLTSGFAAGKENRAQPGDISVPQIRPTQILPEGEIDLSNAYGISVENIDERDYVGDGEVLFNNTNSTSLVGKSAVFREGVPVVCSNHVTRLRLIEGIEPEFVALVLDLMQKLRYFARLCTNFNNQAGVNTATLANVRIPLPPANQRERLVFVMDAARAERKAKLAEADALLAGLDDFVLEALGIAPPPEDNRRVFAVRLTTAQRLHRINPAYYHPERIGALRLLDEAARHLTVASLADVASFERQQLSAPIGNYLSLAHVQSHTGELTAATNTASGNCFTYQTDDVLFARLRPYLNKVHRAEQEGCCSTEFHVLRITDINQLIPDYLAVILRSRVVLAQTVHMMTGHTHPRLTNDDVENLQVPIPGIRTQEVIVAEVVRRREEVRRLRAEAEAGWREAKEWFEGELLGI